MLETRRGSHGITDLRSSSLASDAISSFWPEHEEAINPYRRSSGSVHRNSETFSLQVVLKQAERLTRKEFFSSKTDPYCKLYLDDKEKCCSSSVKMRTLFPFWNERFDFGNVRIDQTLYIKIFDQNLVWKDSFLGMTAIPLHRFVPSTEMFWNSTAPSISRTIVRDLSGRPGKQDCISGCVKIKLIFAPSCRFEATSLSMRMFGIPGGQAIPSISSMDSSAMGELAEGWEERRNVVGRPYYIHHPSLTIQWDRPLKISVDQEETRSNLSLASGTSNFERAHLNRSLFDPVLENVVSSTEPSYSSETFPYHEEDGLPVLPHGWDIRTTLGGNVFFVNHNSQETQWEDPRTGKPYVDSLAQFRRPRITPGPLPAGWTERHTTSGHVYYVDHLGQRTQWDGTYILGKMQLSNYVISSLFNPILSELLYCHV